MPYALPSPFDKRISRVRRRLDKPGRQRGLQNRLLGLRARRDVYRQRHEPPSPIPFNAQRDTTVAGLNRNLADTRSNLAAQEFATKTQYGFDPGFRADPFSKARLLQQTYAQSQRGTVNSYAAGGQLYSGALSNARSSNQQSYLQNYDSEQRAYQDALNKFSQQRLTAQRERDEGVAAASAQALEDALAERPDPSEAPGPSRAVQQYRGLLKKRLKNARRHGREGKVKKIRKRLRSLSAQE